jgi:hypothetical protein
MATSGIGGIERTIAVENEVLRHGDFVTWIVGGVERMRQ